MSPVRHQRQRFLAEHLAAQDLRILEVGAFDSPTWIGEDIPPGLRYLDWYSAEELNEMHKDKPNRNLDRSVRVDYIVKDKHFARHIPGRFDLVIANHVIEHIADPVSWMIEVAEATVAGGHLCLAVPDRGYTFDYIRPESTVADLLRAYEEDLEQPDYWQALESIHLYRPIKAADCWPGPPPADKLGAQRFDLRTSMRHARRAEREYVDCHCFVFTEHSFSAVIADLHEAEIIPWRVTASRGVREGGNEFTVLLAKVN